MGQVHYLAGDTSAGKSSLANAVIYNACMAGHRVDLFGYEDEPEAVVTRLVAIAAQLNNFHLQQGSLNGADLNLAKERVGKLWKALDLEIIHDRPTSVTDLCLQIREGVARRGTKLVVIDYIQLLKRIGEGRNDYERISHIGDGLFHAARSSGVALLVLSQLRRRESQQVTTPRKPTMYDLKGAGDLEQSAFTVLLLWNRKLTGRVSNGIDEVDTKLPVIECNIAKNKNGPTFDLLLYFDEKTTTFEDLPPSDSLYREYKAVAKREVIPR